MVATTRGRKSTRAVVRREVNIGGGVTVDPLRVKVANLIDALGSKSKVAEFLDVSRSQPGKWLSGEETPNPRARRLIYDLDYVWTRLTDARTAKVARIWLMSPNGFLGGALPMVWLRTRGPEAVVGAINGEDAGSYP